MYKCWNCGTEHETQTSNDEYSRGYYAALADIIREYEQAYGDFDAAIFRVKKGSSYE